jgi:cytochrome c biogenesis protein CcmG/thiol:disulfide interchange protein DsbE
MADDERTEPDAKPRDHRPSADWRVGLAAAAIGLGCIVALVFLPRLARSSAQAMRHAAPPFALSVVANAEPGARQDLDALRGSPVLIDFWAYWCAPCQHETPIVARVAKKYESRGLVALGISVDGDDQDAREAAFRFGMTYPVLQDDERHSVQRAYGVDKLPSLVMIDRQGMVVGMTEGMVDEASLEAMVREAL